MQKLKEIDRVGNCGQKLKFTKSISLFPWIEETSISASEIICVVNFRKNSQEYGTFNELFSLAWNRFWNAEITRLIGDMIFLIFVHKIQKYAAITRNWFIFPKVNVQWITFRWISSELKKLSFFLKKCRLPNASFIA